MKNLIKNWRNHLTPLPEKKDVVLGVDPGDTTGIAVLEMHGGALIYETQLSFYEFVKFLEELEAWPVHIMYFVYEDFLLYAHKAAQQRGSKFVAAQVIGVLKAYATKHSIRLRPGRASDLIPAAKASGRPQPRNHKISHQVDAYNHAYYFLCRHRLAKSKLEGGGYAPRKT